MELAAVAAVILLNATPPPVQAPHNMVDALEVKHSPLAPLASLVELVPE
jgi:hypothetical protein